jgi:predicted Zn-dependent protease
MIRDRTKAWFKGTAAAALLAWLSGCAGDQTGALLPPATPLPPETPRVIADDPIAREHAQLVKAFGGEYRASRMQALLSDIAERLVPATERPDEAYRITILDSPVVNAFALPSGRLYVTRGLLALANDTSEIAAVLAHEIAHVTLRHASARSEAALRSALVSRVVADVLKDPVTGAMIQDQSRFTIASFSRAQELEADQIGVRTLAKAGFDPYGASRFLNALGRNGSLSLAPAGDKAKSSADMLSTHPSTPERIALSLQSARRIGAPGLGEGDRARYLAALDGLSYADNPADGIIRGRRFAHPRLGVAFEAPEGFTLENTSQAVLGTSADGKRRLLFDAIDVPAGQGLEAVLRSAWSEGIETGTVESLTVNGRPAAVAASQGKDWSFRMAAIQVGSTTYRLVVAGRPGAGPIDGAFRGALDSVREIDADEARNVRPLRLQAVTAVEGDTVEGLASRMVVPNRATERFLVLNGLERGAKLQPGERYKIIAE